MYKLFVACTALMLSSSLVLASELDVEKVVYEIKSQMEVDKLFNLAADEETDVVYTLGNEEARWILDAGPEQNSAVVSTYIADFPNDAKFAQSLESYTPNHGSEITFDSNSINGNSQRLSVTHTFSIDGVNDYRDFRTAALKAQRDFSEFQEAMSFGDIDKGPASKREELADVQPTVIVKPQYPRRALTRGVEGDCTLVFTVSMQGNVEEPKPFNHECLAVFVRPSLKAIMKFRYDPPQRNGTPIALEGVKYTFEYRLEE